jgi:ketosteroid isomerase-like protein
LTSNHRKSIATEADMSERVNTDIVQSGYEKFGSGDIEGLLQLFAENILWQVPEVENAPFTGVRRGLDETANFFKQLSENETFTRFEPLEFIAQNDKVVVLGEMAATVTSTGRNYESQWVHIFTVRDGKIEEFQEFFDTAAATLAFQKTAAA